MTTTIRTIVALLAVPLMLASASSFADQNADDVASIEKSEWLAVDVDGTSSADHAHHTMKIDVDGSVSGNTGCNHYTATAQIDSENISFADIDVGVTKCQVMVQQATEAAYIAALGKAATYVRNVHVLRIYDADNNEVLKLRRMGTFMLR
jgi:heat shock protein HslJ